MKVLSFSLNDEPSPVAVVSAALTAPVRLIAPIIKARIRNCETTLILVVMTLFRLIGRDTPASNTNRRRPACWTRKNYTSCLRRPGALRFGDISVVRAFDALGHITVTIIHFVNLLHTGEGFFDITHSLISLAEIVHDLLLHLVHGHDFA